MTLSVMCLLEAYDSAVVLFEVPNKCLFVCFFLIIKIIKVQFLTMDMQNV